MKSKRWIFRVRYFTCPPNSGVFVAPTKLTALDVRSDSVASMRDGRSTPASGRITPSFAPRSSFRSTGTSHPFKTPEPPKASASRADRYAGLTSRESTSSRAGSVSPTRALTRSPTRAATSIYNTPKPSSRPSTSGLPGPTPRRSLGVGMATPKPLSAASRNSRVRSPVPDLPTSASLLNGNSPNSSSTRGGSYFGKPITPTLSQTSSDTFVDDDSTLLASTEGKALQANQQALQDRITRLMSGSSSLISDDDDLMRAKTPSSPVRVSYNMLPPPSPSQAIRKLETRIAELEGELQTSRVAGGADSSETSSALTEENARLQSMVASLQARIEVVESTTQDEKDQLSIQLQNSRLALDKLTQESQAQAKEASTRMGDLEVSLTALREQSEKKKVESERLASEGQALGAELGALKETLAKTKAELEDDKIELTREVNELRLAGQVRPRFLPRCTCGRMTKRSLHESRKRLHYTRRSSITPRPTGMISKTRSEHSKINCASNPSQSPPQSSRPGPRPPRKSTTSLSKSKLLISSSRFPLSRMPYTTRAQQARRRSKGTRRE